MGLGVNFKMATFRGEDAKHRSKDAKHHVSTVDFLCRSLHLLMFHDCHTMILLILVLFHDGHIMNSNIYFCFMMVVL